MIYPCLSGESVQLLLEFHRSRRSPRWVPAPLAPVACTFDSHICDTRFLCLHVHTCTRTGPRAARASVGGIGGVRLRSGGSSHGSPKAASSNPACPRADARAPAVSVCAGVAAAAAAAAVET